MMGARAAARAAVERAAIHSPILTEFQQSLQEAIKEVKDPVKTGEKGKALYDQFQEANAKKEQKQRDEENRKKPKRSTASPYSLSPFSHVTPFSVGQHNSDSLTKGDISKIINPPFKTPTREEYSSSINTPTKPQSKFELNRPENKIPSDSTFQSPTFDRHGVLNFNDDTPLSL
jgi:hypothetical protein